MKAKTRAKWYPMPFVFPPAYTAPTDLADVDDWRPGGAVVVEPSAEDGAQAQPDPGAAAGAPPGGGVDKPFNLT